MNCADWEQRLALYAGGDLPQAQTGEVEHHLSECAGCQVFSSGLKQGLELIREAHHETLEAAHFTAVRSRVLAQLERERRPFWHRAWVYGLVLGAVALLLAIAVPPARWAVPPAPQVALAHPPAPEVFATVRKAEPKVAATGVMHRPHHTVPTGEAVLVRMVTDNPDVVIYWISETKGEY